jgi:release factor glutamine methyltransferase
VSLQGATWTVKSILDWCEGYLAKKGDAQPRHSAQWLLGEAMGLSRIELYTNFDKPLSEAERATMRAWVKRRGEGEPLQLICGSAPFRYMNILVEPGVLIPRPETEVLVSVVLEAFPPPKQVSAYAFEDNPFNTDLNKNENHSLEIGSAQINLEGAMQIDEPSEEVALTSEEFGGAQLSLSNAANPSSVKQVRAIDLCTGSGCIACALATEHPGMEVLAIDISPEALTLAKKNIEAQGVGARVSVQEGNLLNSVVADSNNHAAFDVIVSNPPYIPSAVVEGLDAEVNNYEPRLALDGGKDGLNLFRAFVPDALTCLKSGGMLAVELFEESLHDACEFVLEQGFSQARIVKDLAGKDRILVAIK